MKNLLPGPQLNLYKGGVEQIFHYFGVIKPKFSNKAFLIAHE